MAHMKLKKKAGRLGAAARGSKQAPQSAVSYRKTVLKGRK